MDAFLLVLGELESFSSILSIQRPKIKITRNGEIVDEVERTSHDQVLLQGKLSSGAVLSLNLATDKYTDTGLRWTIQGTEGQIEYTSPNPFPQTSPEINVTIFDKMGKSEVVVVDNYHKDAETELLAADALSQAENVARFYEAFRKGETERYSTFQHALKRHRLIEAMYKGQNSYA
jgi:predicted dehydrogenase